MRVLVVLAVVLAGCAQGPPVATPEPMLACDPCHVHVALDSPWEPHGAIDPTDPLHFVAATRAGLPGMTTVVTFDGGLTWQEGYVAVGADAPAGSPLADFDYIGDQVVAFLPDGTVLISGVTIDYEQVAPGITRRAGSGIFVARSTDGGLSFPDAELIAGGSGQHLTAGGTSLDVDWLNHDKPWLAVGSDGQVVVSWMAIRGTGPGGTTLRDAVAYDHMLASSGGAWDTTMLSSDDAFMFTHPAVGTRLAVAAGTPGGTMGVYTDGTFHEIGATAGQPVLRAVDGGFLLAFPESGESGVKLSLWRSADGATWARATAVTALGPALAHMAMDARPDGTAVVAWYEGQDTLDYRVAIVHPDGHIMGPLSLAQNITGPDDALGDYVAMAGIHPDAAIVGWSTGDGLAFARLTWT